MIKAIIFDCDGTLITAEKRFWEVMNDSLKRVSNKKIPYKVFLKNFNKGIVPKLLNELTSDELKKFWSFFLNFYRKPKYWKYSKLNKDVKRTLSKLKKSGLKLAVVPGAIATKEEFKKELKYYGINNFFDIINTNISISMMDKEWKKVSQVRTVLKKLKLKSSECVLVGDFIADIETAKELQMHYILFGTRRFAGIKSNFIIEKFKEITNRVISLI